MGAAGRSATDVAVVHAGYVKRRKALLQAGVTLYERRELAVPHVHGSAGIGSSQASLHAKTFAADRKRRLLAKVVLACPARRACTIDHQRLDDHRIADRKAFHVVSELLDDAGELVTCRKERWRRAIAKPRSAPTALRLFRRRLSCILRASGVGSSLHVARFFLRRENRGEAEGLEP